MVLELDNKEKEVLKQALKSMDDQLKDERLRTDDREMRECLREDQYLLGRILRKVADMNLGGPAGKRETARALKEGEIDEGVVMQRHRAEL